MSTTATTTTSTTTTTPRSPRVKFSHEHNCQEHDCCDPNAAVGGAVVRQQSQERENSHASWNFGALAVGYLSVFIDILGVSIILPVIPFLAAELNATAAGVQGPG